MKTILVLSIFIISFSSVAGIKTEAWNSANNPFKMDSDFEDRFQYLPTKADISLSGFGWPAYFWANKKGGIAQRWSSEDPQHFEYESPSLYKLKVMSQEKINELSPAEKFDILNSRFDYPTVKKVWDQTRRGSASWHGICHGASQAGLHHKEPRAKTITTIDGIKLTFHSSDIKALVAYYYAKIGRLRSIQVGKRCNAGRISPFRGRNCKDTHPAAMHIIMTNKLGLTKEGYIADIDRLKQVWNHVAVKYKTEVVARFPLPENSTPGTHETVQIKTSVDYTGGVNPTVNAILGTTLEKWDTRNYEYLLDLDINGKIIGGAWISKQRPDFMWIKPKQTFEDPYYGKVKELLE